MNATELSRRLSGVQRLHHFKTLFPQSVAEHSYNVAMILTEFYNALPGKVVHGYGIQLHRLLLRALYHDLPEGVTGDIPYPVTTHLKTKLGVDWEELETSTLEASGFQFSSPMEPEYIFGPSPARHRAPTLPLGPPTGSTTTVEEQLLALADMLDLLLYCIEEAERGQSGLSEVYAKALEVSLARYSGLPQTVRGPLAMSPSVDRLLYLAQSAQSEATRGLRAEG